MTDDPLQPAEETTPSVTAPARDWRTLLLLALILLAGGWLRLTGLDWDSGEHLHPDERFLTMVSSAMSPPVEGDFLGYMDSDTSTMNPRNVGHSFYVYGTFPLTIVRMIAGWATSTDFYSIYMVGRQMSVLYDLLAILLVFGIGARLYDRRVGLLAAGFTAFTAFNIQQAHFFTVDVAANFFFLLFLYFAVGMVRRRSWPETLGAGLAMGMALASKISLWPMAPVAMIALGAEAWRDANVDAEGSGTAGKQALLRWVLTVALLGTTSFLTLRLAQPDMFAGPGWPNVAENPARLAEVTAGAVPHWWFRLEERMPEALKPVLLPDPRWAENMSRISGQVQGYGMDWPPNHQWWGRADWFFPLQNMIRWGMGIPLGLAAWAGWLLVGWQLLRRRRLVHLLPWLWTSWMFGFYGAQWGKTMRYFLPIYPTLTLFAAFLLVLLWDRSKGALRPMEGAAADGETPDPASDRRAEEEPGATVQPATVQPATGQPATASGPGASPGLAFEIPAWLARMNRPALAGALGLIVLAGTLLWGFMFSRIYTREHSRIIASHWIYHNIPTAFGVRVAGDEQRDFGPMRLLPVRPPSDLTFEVETYRYRLDGSDASRWFGPGPLLVPGGKALAIDGFQLAHAELGAAAPLSGTASTGRVTLRAVVSRSDQLGPDGQPQDIVTEGSASFDRVAAPRELVVPLPEAELEPGYVPLTPPRGISRKLREIFGQPFEPKPDESPRYYVWMQVDGDAISGRTSIFADQTTWDDTVPRGVDGYGPWDQADTTWAEGMYGFVQLDLYHEDKDPSKIEWTLDGLAKADYTIATSNRVYGAVRQMPTRYPMTIALYDDMFQERLGFVHTASIHSVPSLGPFEIDDQPAEEAFHVYDHPQVDIWATDGVDFEALRAELQPLTGPDSVTWQWPTDQRSMADRYIWPWLGLLPFFDKADFEATAAAEDPGIAAVDAPPPPEALMLSEARLEAERSRADYVFDLEGISARWPWLSVLLWYLVLSLIGLAVFPLLYAWLPNMTDRGWSISRTAGLLITSWSAWLIASLGWMDHKPPLLWACLAALASLAWLGAGSRRGEILAWIRRERRLILGEELLFLLIFAIFLGIRWGNPDLWHPYYGGEKPMDFAYLNATLRSVSFPPFDPWFAGGKLNYYYFGFVFIGALMELTRVLPWVAYNLAIPSLAAMTGLGVAGLVHSWLSSLDVRPRIAAGAGALGAVLAVLAGNLYQLRFIAEALASEANLAYVGLQRFQSEIPGLGLTVDALRLLPQWLQGKIGLGVQTGHWYWNASRAIPAQGDVVPITEMPFFTFVYADLHAHMMALPITVLALTVALSWAIPTDGDRDGYWWLEPWRLGRLALGALAVGALWPTNTWDYPTYGLVAAGALAAGQWQRLGGPSIRWVIHVGIRGAALLGLSLLFFRPYHANYITPYADFQFWQGTKTPPDAFLIVHGIFLFAILSWALTQLDDALASATERRRTGLALLVSGLLTSASLYWLWGKTTGNFTPASEYPPSPWTPVIAGVFLTLALGTLLRPRLRAPERFAAWLFVLGLLLALFVEFGVLAGDIGRMNTVFKFYIQIWVLWAALAAFAAGWLAERWERSPGAAGAGAWFWQTAFGLLVAAGLIYTVTAARAKISDRFHPAYGMPEAVRADYESNYRPGLSGIDYMDYAYYAEGDRALALGKDKPAMLWLLENVKGSPTILEAYNYNGGYRWGARYSIYTGLPTVIGWDWHQKQQRNAVGGWLIDERTRDVADIYNGVDERQTRVLLDQYGVEYVIVGEEERVLYDAAGLAKFERWAESGEAERVYASEEREPGGEPVVAIYRLLPTEGAEAVQP